MFDAARILAVLWVILVWGTLYVAIRHWGPGIARRGVSCPETRTRAKVNVLQVEPHFGAIQARDIVACSLFGGGPVACDKKCLAQL